VSQNTSRRQTKYKTSRMKNDWYVKTATEPSFLPLPSGHGLPQLNISAARFRHAELHWTAVLFCLCMFEFNIFLNFLLRLLTSNDFSLTSLYSISPCVTQCPQASTTHSSSFLHSILDCAKKLAYWTSVIHTYTC